MTDDYRDDHEFGTELGAQYLAADEGQRQVILRQLLAGAADPEHAVAAALAVWRGGLASYPLPDGRRLAYGQTWHELTGPRRRLQIEFVRPEPGGRVLAICRSHRPGRDRAGQAILSADRFADRDHYLLVDRK
ncbi:hypothetical protein [Nocardia salmonicida]|uniref:hypothetical protein n=1 Tax=Nocardia salmonicida TaxID=53431 RepID=UPI0007A4B1F0|nr:hypothetical protein [Nocardia salmonicida]